jgi:hypothetical protein
MTRKDLSADAGMLAVSVLVPGGIAAALAGNVPDAAHDRGVARVLGLDAEPWRALDALVGSLLSIVPIGTHAMRAELCGALVASASGAILYVVVRELLKACAETTRLGPIVAAIAALSALVAPTWQVESAAVGGSALGAALVLLPIAVGAAAGQGRGRGPWMALAFSLGLAMGYEPLVGACALCASAILVLVSAPSRRALAVEWRNHKGDLAAGLLAGLGPLIVGLASARRSGLSAFAALADGWSGERGVSSAESPLSFMHEELGALTIVLGVGGCALAGLVPRARPIALALTVTVAVGFGCAKLASPLGPTRYGAPVLAALAAGSGLAGVGLQAIVRRIASARIPFARSTASMVLLLALARPVDAADDSLARPRSAAAAAWDDVAWGALAPRTVLLLADPLLCARARATQARGALRDDLIVVASVARAPIARRALSSDASLVPLWRDLEMIGSPSEGSLSGLAAARPVAMEYEPRWGRALSRHLVPASVFDRFEVEPRGASDRRYALDAFAHERDRLTRIVRQDPDLRFDTAALLLARALVIAQSGDRDLVGRAVDDVRRFAPDDPVAAEILARAGLAKGAARFDDLHP